MLAFAIAMAVCVGTGFYGTPLATVICSLAAIANLARMMANCAAPRAVAAAASVALLKIDLATCGILIFEP